MTTSPFLYFWKACLAGLILMTLTTRESVAAPEISITGGSGAFGLVLVGTQPTQTITINNTGADPLNVTGITLAGTGFSFVTAPTFPIVVPITTGTYSFQVRFSPTARQAYSGTLTIASNDADEASVVIPLSGTGIAPEIEVEQPVGTGLTDGTTTVTFPQVDLGSSPLFTERTFTVKNTGDSNLTGLSISGLAGTDFSVTVPPSASVAPAGQTTFTVRFAPTVAGLKTVTLQLANSDANENPFDIPLQATATAPIITVEVQGGSAVANNGTVNFGSTPVGFASDRTLIIRNTGTSALNLSSFSILGTNNRLYNIVGDTPTSIGAGLSDSFLVRFGPSETGTFGSASISIANNSATTPFTINVTGTGTANVALEDAFGYKAVSIAGGNILPFIEEGEDGVIKEATLTGIDKAVPIDIGFDFFFYDKLYTRCSISTTGLISFGGSTVDYTPDPIPTSGLPNNFIAPLWTDLEITADSKILYKTHGTSPSRIFVVKYENVKLYHNGAFTSDKRLTFQVQLYETSNAIEVRYSEIDPSVAFSPQQVTVGIESRDYGTETPQPGVGVVGIQFRNGLINNAANRPWIGGGGSILFTRPVVITVESKYDKPTPIVGDPNAVTPVNVGSTSIGLNPSYGTIYRTAIGSAVRFEAPKYIYLNQNFEELEEAGDVNDTNSNNVAWYRLANDGYSIDGQPVQGAQSFAEITVSKDIKFVWRWELEFAVNVKFPGVGTPSPEVGRNWYKLNSPLTASVDTLVDSEVGGVRLKTTGYKITHYGPTGPLPPVSFDVFVVGTRATTAPLTITAPLQLEWLTSGQVRYRFSAASGVTGEAGIPFDGMAFVRVYDTNGANPVTTYAMGSTTDVWINSDPANLTPVEVGAFFRTSPNNNYTLADFPVAPGGDLAVLGTDISKLNDEVVPERPPSVSSRLARTYKFNSGALATRVRPTPTEIRWIYQPTVYRAEVPLGSSFDPTKTMPPLDDGINNRILSEAGPNVATFEVVGDLLTGNKSAGLPLRWDQVDLKLYPVHPSTHRISWEDKNDRSKIYKIEVVSGYPGQTVNLTSEREGPDGTRQGTAPAYVTQTTLETIDVTNPGVGFPAQADNAHYRHLFDPTPDRRPPTKLDISTTDEWKFLELPYTDNGTGATAQSGTPGAPLVSQGTGRSVALYSYRPNSDEIADGSLSKEKLAVRVIRSSLSTPILADDSKLVLGRRGLELGGGTVANRGAFGVVRPAGSSSVNPGTSFVLDFWLNAKDIRDIPVTLTGCSTDGTETVTCLSTTGLVAGMAVSGANIPSGAKIESITNSTTFVLDIPTNDSGSALVLNASGKPVTILTTKGDKLKIVLSPVESTISATYFGVTLTKTYLRKGAAWRHHVIHVFANQVSNGPEATILNYYVDGVRDEVGFVTTTKKSLIDTAGFDVTTTLTANSLRLGVDADPTSKIQMDQLRLFAGLPLTSSPATPTEPWLSEADVHMLRTTRNIASKLRATPASLWFSFDKYVNGGTTGPITNPFANSGSLADVTIGPVTTDGSGVYAGTLAHVDLQEVATRLESTLDNAGFSGSGYVLNGVSNYNAEIYTRTAEVGQWGPIFPVNHGQLYLESNTRLEIAYYENPYRTDRFSHPNVAWPYQAALYTEMKYPSFGPHKDKAIYIASRIGSEGVDSKGQVQEAYDLSQYAGLKIYNQPEISQAGYNPNEEHALVAASGRAALKLKNAGEDIANNPPLAAFALQADLNAKSSSYSSDPWVLVQVGNLVTGEPEMAAYQVFKTRTGTLDFPRPSDSTVASTPGLDYESATTPEDRFLITDKTKTFDFKYEFTYTAFAGDLLIPPYPLNIVIGNTSMADARGRSLVVNGVSQRTLWRDVNKNAWVVSGNGQFFHQFFYPLRGDFYPPNSQPIGTPVAWVPDSGSNFTGAGTSLNPVKVVYDTFWRSNYPKLKRGETLTYQGGEYFNETPGSNGLPALVAMKATELVYDSATPSMVYGSPIPNLRHDLSQASARIVRPLDRRESSFTVANMGVSGFTPAASTKVFIIAERWYFKELPGSLQKRFYYDSLAQQLVFRGYLNDKDSGNKDLTVGPDPLNILEPNVLTLDDYNRIRALSTATAWTAVIDQMYLLSQNPHGVTAGNTSASSPIKNLQGVRNRPANYPEELTSFWIRFIYSFIAPSVLQLPEYVPLDSFGVGSALVPNANLLTQTPTGSLYVTIAENNRSELAGAPVSLHIVEIIPDRYRGAIKVIEAADAFSEKISLQHNGEFGGNTGDLYYEWWIRDASSLDEVAQEVLANGTLKEFDASGNSLWQQYLPKERLENNNLVGDAKHYGLNSIVFEGRPDVVLADKLVLMRYRHKNEANWTLVPFEVANPVAAWKPGTSPPISAAPFQWAGAANSPQLQADGSKRYVPQLVMGWVKRVLDRINPYEARYTDFFSNESPATYSSQIQIAGAPYAGNVALNPDKNVIENTGLIELYMTVLNRARALSIDNSSNGVASDGIKQALLLAATRLSVLFELLAREAYSDAQDSTINAGEDGSLLGIAPFTHAFQNMESDLMHEELALLRGTDFLKSYPVYNRMFWNYAKGLGEAAYNVNYNIYDVDTDGFINENDARKLYPQGHGDAWGHFMSAIGMHYTLLQHPGFSWRSRSELYSLMQNVLEVDYLDEKSFAKLASAKARTGRDIVRGTYRMNYTQDPDGQWQGYTDGADPARAWGVSEWAHRAGQGAWFDFAVANALFPEQAPGANPENLDRIERSAAKDEIGEIAGGLHEIQIAMDEANGGVNPLGLDTDALAMDIDPFYNGSDWELETHFEQVFNRAVDASGNALAALEFATQSGNKLRALGDDTEALIQAALSQDLDYRNRLIEIFGRPYTGTIGFGKAYPEGYEGPDTLLFAYLDKITIDKIVPPKVAAEGANATVTFDTVNNTVLGLMDNQTMKDLYSSVWGGDGTTKIQAAFETLIGSNNYLFELDPDGSGPLSGPSFTSSYNTASKYGFEVTTAMNWGQRTSYGKLQQALEDMLADEIEIDSAVAAYIGYLADFEQKLHRIQSQLALFDQKNKNHKKIADARLAVNIELTVLNTIFNIIASASEAALYAANGIKDGLPIVNGFSNDFTSIGRGIASVAHSIAMWIRDNAETLKELNQDIVKTVQEAYEFGIELNNDQIEQLNTLEGMLEDFEDMTGSEQPMRNAIGSALLNLEIHRQEYVTAQAEGFRLLREREAFNKILAAKVQKNRYQDMIFRLSRNEAMTKYQSAFNHAARYAWLAARAYDYETSLDTGHPAAPGALLDKIVKERQLGLWTDGEPQVGNGGLAEILAQLNANFKVLKGQLGINNPQRAIEKVSLRSELFRIMSYDQEVYDAFDTPVDERTPEQVALVEENPGAPASRSRWQDAIKARIVPDLNRMPEFVRHCRPFAPGVQPGIVIRFPTSIEPGRNLFGLQLAAGDHNYSTANYSTKVQAFGVWLDHYAAAGLSTAPRAYLVPTGNDYLRTSTSALPIVRSWNVVEQRIPIPYTINQTNLNTPGYIPALNGIDGVFGELRRHGDFRMYHDEGDPEAGDDDTLSSGRLYGRSVWNSEWMLVIPGANLHYDPSAGLEQLADSISDIKLHFQTYSHQGQ